RPLGAGEQAGGLHQRGLLSLRGRVGVSAWDGQGVGLEPAALGEVLTWTTTIPARGETKSAGRRPVVLLEQLLPRAHRGLADLDVAREVDEHGALPSGHRGVVSAHERPLDLLRSPGAERELGRLAVGDADDVDGL